MYGWSNEKKLVKWDPEEARELYKCLWIKGYKIKRFISKKKEEEYYIELFKLLLVTLPKSELEKLKSSVSGLNLKKDRKRFYTLIRNCIMHMNQKLSVHNSYKSTYLKNQNITIPTQNDISFDEYRQNEKLKQNGYLPYNVLSYYAPIEILEHAGFKLYKYDKIKNNYYIIIESPIDLNNEPIILYNEDPIKLENEGEQLFENKIDEYLKIKSNPYGDKSYVNVDISNIESIMTSNDENPLESDIF